MKHLSGKKHHILAVLFFMLITVSLFAFAPNLKANAIAYDPDTSAKFRVTVYWDVKNPSTKEDTNYMDLYYYKPTSVTYIKDTYSQRGCVTVKNMADSSGSHSKTFELSGPPKQIYYSCYGTSFNPAEWYITKITVEPIDSELSSKTITYWEGKMGLKIAHVTGRSNTMSLYFEDSEPTFGDWWHTDIGTNFSTTTVSYFDGQFKPQITTITEPSGESTAYVPTDDTSNVYTYKPGMIYDQYGARWPFQLNDVSFSCSNSAVTYTDNTITVPHDANDKDDYNIKLQYKDVSKSYSSSKTISVKTFDYNVTFTDEDWGVLKTQTVDHGESAEPPSVPNYKCKNGMFYKFEGWSGDQYTDLTSGELDRTVNTVYAAEPSALSGSGTSDDPYLICSNEDWNLFCDYCNYGYTDGKYFKLKNYLNVQTMAGTSGNDFQGVFDGNGNTIQIDYTSDGKYTAPFRYVKGGTNGPAVIKDLTVKGLIAVADNSHKYAGGIVGGCWGDTEIINCKSSVNIHTHVTSGDGSHGGLVGLQDGTMTISGCVFDGKFLGVNTDSCGGFAGWNSGTLTINDSVFDPAEITFQNTNCAAFARNGGTFNNCYYTKDLNDGTSYTGQGKKMHTIDEGEKTVVYPAGEYTYYRSSKITAYSTGIKYNGHYYAGKDDIVELSMSYEGKVEEGYTCAFQTSAGTLEGNTLTMPDEDVLIYAVQEPVRYTVTWKNGDKILKVIENVLGEIPEYDGEIPERAADALYRYKFDGWDKSVSDLNGSITFNARFTKTAVAPSANSTVTLSIGQNGSVTADGIKYTGDASFDKSADNVVTYTITPDSGYRIECVLYNGKNVTASVSDGVFTAPALTGDTVLTVRFTSSVQPDDSIPRTGDDSNRLAILISIIGLAAMGAVLFTRKTAGSRH